MLDMATVCCETSEHQLFLMRLEKLAIFWPGCDEEERGKGDHCSDQALDNEDPVVAAQFFKLVRMLCTKLTNAIPHSLPRHPSWLRDMQGTKSALVLLITKHSHRCRTPLNAPARMAALKKMEYRN